MNVVTIVGIRPRPLIRRLGEQPWAWLAVAAAVMWALAGFISGHFTTSFFVLNATLATFLAIAGLAQMVVLTAGDGSVDLSVGYVMTVAAFIAAVVMNGSHSILLGVVLSIVAGVTAGMVNGLLVTVFNIPAIIATLAVGYIWYSGALVLEGEPNLTINSQLASFVHLRPNGVPVMLVIAVGLALVIGLLLHRTVYGQDLHAVGQSRLAAFYAGLPVKRVVFFSFLLSGTLGALAGLLLVAYSGGAFISMGNTYVLGSVSAVVIGGTPVSGGRSSVLGTVAGALVITLLVSLLEVSKLSIGVEDIAEGAVIIGVVLGSGWGQINRQTR